MFTIFYQVLKAEVQPLTHQELEEYYGARKRELPFSEEQQVARYNAIIILNPRKYEEFFEKNLRIKLLLLRREF